MTAISQVIDLTITVQDAQLSGVPFGVGLVLAETHAFAERVKSFGSLAEVGTEFGTSSSEYAAATGPFSQSNQPDVLKFGRVPATMTLTPTVPLQNNTIYSVTFNGVTFAYTSDGSATAQEIVEGIVDAATTNGYPITAVNTGTKTFTISGNQVSKIAVGATITIDGSTGNDGDYTVVSRTFSTPDTLIVVSQTIPDATADGAIKAPVTLTENNVVVAVPDGSYAFSNTANLSVAFTAVGTYSAALDLCAAADPAFYYVYATTRTTAKQESILDWVEANQRLSLLAEATAAAVNDSPSTDTTSLMHHADSQNLTRGGAMYYPDAATEYPEGSWTSLVLQYQPGQAVFAFKDLPGYEATNLTTNQLNNLNGKNGNYYVSARDAFGNTQTYGYPGTAGSGRFFDITIAVDALRNALVQNIFALFKNNLKVPYTEAGVEQVKSAVRAAVASLPNAIASLDSLTAPNPATVPSNIKATRTLPDVNFTVTLSGAIQSVQINGTVQV